MDNCDHDYTIAVWKKRNAIFIKCVAVVLSVIFCEQQIGWAQQGRPVWVQAKPVDLSLQDKLYKNDFEIPYDIANTKEAIPGRGDETIIHIQDAHSSLSAQYSISKLLDSLVTNYDLNFIAIEGGRGYIDTSILKTFPDKDVRRKVAESFVEEGRMSAGEFYSITCERDDILLYGIEDDALYQKNLESFREVAVNCAARVENINEFLSQLSLLEEKVFSPELRAFNQSCVLHREGKKSFIDHWTAIKNDTPNNGKTSPRDVATGNTPNNGKTSPRDVATGNTPNNGKTSPRDVATGNTPNNGKTSPRDVATGNTPNNVETRFIASPQSTGELSKLLRSIELEKNINFDKANTERCRLIDELSPTLEKKALEALVLKSIVFKQNKISQSNFHAYLIELAESKSISPENYENLIRFTEYITLYESVEIFKLYKEMAEVENNLREKLFRNNDEKELFRIIKMARLLKQLNNMELTNGEFEHIKENRSSFIPAECAEFIKNSCLKYYVMITDGYNIHDIFNGNLDKAMEFYQDAEARNSAMLSNTIKKMRVKNKQVAALISGGYHTDGLTDIMKQKGLSYLVVIPKFESGKERPYIAVLTNKRKPYEKLLETGKYQLAIEPVFQDMMGTNILVPETRKQLVREILTKISKFMVKGRITEEIIEIWESAYKERYGRLLESVGQKDMAEKMPPEQFTLVLSELRDKEGEAKLDVEALLTRMDALETKMANFENDKAIVDRISDEKKVLTDLVIKAIRMNPDNRQGAVTNKNIREILRNVTTAQDVNPILILMLPSNWRKNKELSDAVNLFIAEVTQEIKKLNEIDNVIIAGRHDIQNKIASLFAFIDLLMMDYASEIGKVTERFGVVKGEMLSLLEGIRGKNAFDPAKSIVDKRYSSKELLLDIVEKEIRIIKTDKGGKERFDRLFSVCNDYQNSLNRLASDKEITRPAVKLEKFNEIADDFQTKLKEVDSLFEPWISQEPKVEISEREVIDTFIVTHSHEFGVGFGGIFLSLRDVFSGRDVSLKKLAIKNIEKILQKIKKFDTIAQIGKIKTQTYGDSGGIPAYRVDMEFSESEGELLSRKVHDVLQEVWQCDRSVIEKVVTLLDEMIRDHSRGKKPATPEMLDELQHIFTGYNNVLKEISQKNSLTTEERINVIKEESEKFSQQSGELEITRSRSLISAQKQEGRNMKGIFVSVLMAMLMFTAGWFMVKPSSSFGFTAVKEKRVETSAPALSLRGGAKGADEAISLTEYESRVKEIVDQYFKDVGKTEYFKNNNIMLDAYFDTGNTGLLRMPSDYNSLMPENRINKLSDWLTAGLGAIEKDKLPEYIARQPKDLWIPFLLVMQYDRDEYNALEKTNGIFDSEKLDKMGGYTTGSINGSWKRIVIDTKKNVYHKAGAIVHEGVHYLDWPTNWIQGIWKQVSGILDVFSLFGSTPFEERKSIPRHALFFKNAAKIDINLYSMHIRYQELKFDNVSRGFLVLMLVLSPFILLYLLWRFLNKELIQKERKKDQSDFFKKRRQKHYKEEPRGIAPLIVAWLSTAAAWQGIISWMTAGVGTLAVFIPYLIYKYWALHAVTRKKVDPRKKDLTVEQLQQLIDSRFRGNDRGFSLESIPITIIPDNKWNQKKSPYAYTDSDGTIYIKETVARSYNRALIPILMHEKGEAYLNKAPPVIQKGFAQIPLLREELANFLEFIFVAQYCFEQLCNLVVAGFSLRRSDGITRAKARGYQADVADGFSTRHENAETIPLTKTEQDFLSATGFEKYRKGQVLAMRALKDGTVVELRTGGGKTDTLAGAALCRYEERKEKTLILTHEDELTSQAMDDNKMGEKLSNCGVITGFILPDTDKEEGEIGYIYENGIKRDATVEEVYEKSIVIYTKWERVVHRKMREKLGQIPKAILKNKYFTLFDEIDLMLVFGRATPCVISGGDLEDWPVRRIARRFINDNIIKTLKADKGAYLEHEDEREVFLTNKGQNMVRKAFKKLLAEKPEVKDIVEVYGETFVIDSLKAHLYYKNNQEYYEKLDAGGKLVGVGVYDSKLQERKKSMTFGEGLQQAIEMMAGVADSDVSSETYTLMSETIEQFIRDPEGIVIAFAGATGTAEAKRFNRIYPDKKVEHIEGETQRLNKDAGYTGFNEKTEKWQALIKRVESRYAQNQPIGIKVESDADTDKMKEHLEKNLSREISDRVIINIADGKDPVRFRKAISHAGYANVITIFTNMAHRGIDIEVQGCCLNKDGTKGREVALVKGKDGKDRIPGLHVISTYLDEAEAFEIQTQGRADRGKDEIGEGTWEGLFSFDEKFFKDHPKLLAHHKPLLEKAVGAQFVILRRAKPDEEPKVKTLIKQARDLIVDEEARNDEEKSKFEDKVFSYQEKLLKLYKAVELKKAKEPRFLESIGIYDTLEKNIEQL
ncbi:MAG: hypothetical protein ABH844_02405, partial [Candidatus Omnitrophota bacterium]